MLSYLYTHHMGWGWSVLMTIGWLILLGLFVAVLVAALRDHGAKQSARELLDQRLANGEISIEDYQRMRAAMSSRPSGPSVSDPPAPA